MEFTATHIFTKALPGTCLSSPLSQKSLNGTAYLLIRDVSYESTLVSISLDHPKVHILKLKGEPMLATDKDMLSPVFLYQNESYFITTSVTLGMQINQIFQHGVSTGKTLNFSARRLGFLADFGLMLVETIGKHMIAIDISSQTFSFISDIPKGVISASSNGKFVMLSLGSLDLLESIIFLSGADAENRKEYVLKQRINRLNSTCSDHIATLCTDKTFEVFDGNSFERKAIYFADTNSFFLCGGAIGDNYYIVESVLGESPHSSLTLYKKTGVVTLRIQLPFVYAVDDAIFIFKTYLVLTVFTGKRSELIAVDMVSRTIQEIALIPGSVVSMARYGDKLVVISDTANDKYIVTMFQLDVK